MVLAPVVPLCSTCSREITAASGRCYYCETAPHCVRCDMVFTCGADCQIHNWRVHRESPPSTLLEPCGYDKKMRDNHQVKIHVSTYEDAAKGVWCDCCGGTPVAIFPQFNRLKHTARLCEDCMNLGTALLI